MCILYKQTTKEFVHFDTKTKRSDLITDIRLASELTNAEAKELLKKCTKKLKGFQITQIESFQAKEPAAPAIVIPAQPAETTTATAESVQQVPETPTAAQQQAAVQSVQPAATQPAAVQPTQPVHPMIQPITKTPRRCFTSKERSEIYIRDKGRCGICGEFIPLNEFTIDHIVPISKGGTYDYDNLQCCCFKCNQLKSNEMPDDFYGKMFIALINHAKQQNNKKVKIPHTQGDVACNTYRNRYLKPTQPSRLGLPLALWFVRIQARCHLCSHNSTWKSFRVAAASGHLTGTAYGQAVKP